MWAAFVLLARGELLGELPFERRDIFRGCDGFPQHRREEVVRFVAVVCVRGAFRIPDRNHDEVVERLSEEHAASCFRTSKGLMKRIRLVFGETELRDELLRRVRSSVANEDELCVCARRHYGALQLERLERRVPLGDGLLLWVAFCHASPVS